jgi:hypothetical protein
MPCSGGTFDKFIVQEVPCAVWKSSMNSEIIIRIFTFLWAPKAFPAGLHIPILVSSIFCETTLNYDYMHLSFYSVVGGIKQNHL